MLNYIIWDANPVIIDSFVTVRWYGLMFAIGFWIGFNIVAKMFKHEGAPEKWMGILLIWVGLGTVVGARLGHVFFYAWDYYSQHPWKILATWEGDGFYYSAYEKPADGKEFSNANEYHKVFYCNSSGRRAHTLRQSDELRNLRT